MLSRMRVPSENSSSAAPFHKVVVANRGEIARRIFRTLREMGIATVAVYSDADRDATFVAEADEAVRLGGAPAAESYLNQEAVIAAAKATGAEAIHPGYGFLAENAGFAARCAEAGLTFIGPSPEAIRRMGDKAEARALAAEVGLPVIDGFSAVGLDGETIRRKVGELGLPALIKAAAGGGGKGMRAVSDPAELDDALAAAAREAEAAFGDGSLLVERLLDSPRHVEVQVLGDAGGRVVHLFERDCSVQRRHQKVFEECPSPAVDGELRARMGTAAVALAREVGYQGAGTVEFLLDATGEFFFLEMNTRLQVEHPVTEAVTGLDLVRLQVEIAQGLPLPFEQGDLELTGHAIEARLYAEDPANDFLPATGTVSLWAEPELPGLRIDGGVELGDEVTVHYDPLLAKVIAHGRDRAEALRRLHRGLSELAAGGLTTNREFLRLVLEHDAFRRGEVDTAFVDRRLPADSRSRPIDGEVLAQHAAAAALHLFHRRRQRPSPVPAGIPSGWRNNRWRPQEQAFDVGLPPGPQASDGGERLGVRHGARRRSFRPRRGRRGRRRAATARGTARPCRRRPAGRRDRRCAPPVPDRRRLGSVPHGPRPGPGVGADGRAPLPGARRVGGGRRLCRADDRQGGRGAGGRGRAGECRRHPGGARGDEDGASAPGPGRRRGAGGTRRGRPDGRPRRGAGGRRAARRRGRLMAQPRQVRYEVRGPAAWIVLDRPEKRNALSGAMIAQLGEALNRARADRGVRAVVLTGRGPAFCAGADLDAGLSRPGSDLADAVEESRNPFADLLRQLQHFPRPVIVAVNGPAFGGGLGLVAAADVVIASTDASFSFSEVRLGLIPAMISVVVLPRIGPHHARRLFLTGRRFSAEEAVQYGLAHRAVPPEELEAAAREEVADVARGGPVAVAEAKRLIREIPELQEDEAFARASERFAERLRSDEACEGMAAFAEKRPPKWRS